MSFGRSGGKPVHSSMPWKNYKSGAIADAWVHQLSECGKCRMNVSFREDAFFSYSTVIASRIRHRRRVAYVLDWERFSVRTSTHQGMVRHAVRNSGVKTFCVHSGSYNQRLDFTPKRLRDWYFSEFSRKDDLPGNCKEITRNRDFMDRVNSLREAIDVCGFFGLAAGRLERILGAKSKLIEERVAAIAAHQEAVSKRAEARRDKEAAVRLAARVEAEEEAILRAERLLVQFRWEAPPEEENLSFGNDFYLLNTRLDLKVEMMRMAYSRERESLEESRSSVYRELWEAQKKADELDEIKGLIRPANPSSGRVITFED